MTTYALITTNERFSAFAENGDYEKWSLHGNNWKNAYCAFLLR